MSELQIPINSVIAKLKSRIRGYETAIQFHADTDSEVVQESVRNYQAIVKELNILLEDYQDLKYRIEFGH